MIVISQFDEFLRANSERDIYFFTKNSGNVSKYVPSSNLHYNYCCHRTTLSMSIVGSKVRFSEFPDVSIEDFFIHKTDGKNYFIFVGKNDYIFLTSDSTKNYMGKNIIDILKDYPSEESKILWEEVEALKKRVAELEKSNRFIYNPQCPPQITGPLEWSSKPHPWIRSSNRSDG